MGIIKGRLQIDRELPQPRLPTDDEWRAKGYTVETFHEAFMSDNQSSNPDDVREKAAERYANCFVAKPNRELTSWQEEKATDFRAGWDARNEQIKELMLSAVVASSVLRDCFDSHGRADDIKFAADELDAAIASLKNEGGR